MTKTVFMYPGQGSQYKGMGGRAIEVSSAAEEVFVDSTKYASKKLKRDIGRLMLEGPEEELNDTRIAQPTIFIASITGSTALRSILGYDADKHFGKSGHSFGNIAALHDDGVFSTHTGIDLSIERGEAMHQASLDTPGSMAAVFRITEERLIEICKKWGVSLANDNSHTELIISGDINDVESARLDIKANGGKSILLKVRAGAHSPRVQAAADRMAKLADKLQVKKKIHLPDRLSVMSSRTIDYLANIADIKADIAGLTERVEWRRTIIRLLDEGYDEFIEPGPGAKLSTLPKRDPVMQQALDERGASMESFDDVLGRLAA